MIADGLIKAFMPVNYKVFIKMIDLKDQEECLASIKLEQDQRNVLLPCRAKQNSKAFGYGASTSWYV